MKFFSYYAAVSSVAISTTASPIRNPTQSINSSQLSNHTAHSGKEHDSARKYEAISIHELMTNATAYNEALADCAWDLSKASNETRAKFAIGAKHNDRLACRIILADVLPHRRPQLNHTRVGKGRHSVRSCALVDSCKAMAELGAIFIPNTIAHFSEHAKRDSEIQPYQNAYKDQERQRLNQWKQDITKRFSNGVQECITTVSHSSTGTPKLDLDGCVKNVTDDYSRDLISAEQGSLRLDDLLLPGPPQMKDIFNKGGLRKDAADHLVDDLANCRILVLHELPSLTEHQPEYSTYPFKQCVEDAAKVYANKLDLAQGPFANASHRLHALHNREAKFTDVIKDFAAKVKKVAKKVGELILNDRAVNRRDLFNHTAPSNHTALSTRPLTHHDSDAIEKFIESVKKMPLEGGSE
ncbi:uncharacterized protein LY89DRAFT_718211 [Mollisia scopiformis]|uniref:Uncharacterized protein n=1 Tax=Mollisia scopiformis TaxID=149040 RepID=A0A194XBJ1_MOLSC|nr:uncharacterized protein LY89DRAFT_718211 [Mollisia scopiformis]KUJ17528.1 hypothetical protein LY89DRAFT_718211 [Mollisia scopiformis]